MNAVVVRQWHGKYYGPGGKTVFRSNASVAKAAAALDDYHDCSLIENCCIKGSQAAMGLETSAAKDLRVAVRVHALFTLLRFALANRLPAAR